MVVQPIMNQSIKPLIKGIEESHNLNIVNIDIFADSELIVKQINGEYKVRNERMQVLHSQAINLLDKLKFLVINTYPSRKKLSG